MKKLELEKIIYEARRGPLTKLDLSVNELTSLPESIGNFSNLPTLDLSVNELTSLPESIGNLSNLTTLRLNDNQLTSLPESIGNLSNLTELCLHDNELMSLPESIGNLSNLTTLDLSVNELTSLPESIGNLSNLTTLSLTGNELTSLPESISNFSNLTTLSLTGNPFVDLSSVQSIPNLRYFYFFGVNLPRWYWTKLSDWKPKWLLDEDNAEIRRILIQQVGYEKILEELNSLTLDIWREYTLLKIDGIEEIFYHEYEPTEREPMVLLKMTCPSTAHIHILRVPPEMVSAEAAITWVNHGIHPDSFAVQT
jgi:leucine-rich repeat protein SHOC2